MLDLMRDIILATDLAHHLRIFKDLQKMAEGEAPGMEIGIGVLRGGRNSSHQGWEVAQKVLAVPKVLLWRDGGYGALS